MMRRLTMWIVLLLVATLLLGGCSGVRMNAQYSQLLDETAALSAKTAALATDGQLTAQQMVQALQQQAEIWQLFRDARDGVDSTKDGVR